jgi:hypothetical protein
MTLVLNGTTGVSSVDGSASTPAIQGTDSNTGVFFPAADTIAFAEGGAEVARFDSSGNFGLGTSSPTTNSKLDIQVGSSTSNYGLQVRSFDAGSGDGTTTAKVYRAVNSTNGSWANAQYDAWRHIWTKDGTTEFMRIDSSGNLLVGTTTTDIWTGSATNTGFRVESNGTTTLARSGFAALLVKRTTASTGNLAEFAYGTSVVGTISTNGTGTTYGTSSDYRLKHDIQPMTGALAKVAALKPVTYKWNVDGSNGEGFIAHELQAVCPDAVTGEKDAVDAEGNPVYQGIDTSFLVATLTAAIQELKAELDTAKARIAALEAA